MQQQQSRLIEPYRFFFPAAALHAAITIPLWLASRAGHFVPTTLLPPGLWHTQEMLFGYALAVIAGYLLPAVPLRQYLSLIILWLAARLIWLIDTPLPALTPLIATLFPLMLSWQGALRFKAAKRNRNRVFAFMLLGMGFVALIFHLLVLTGQALLAYRFVFVPLFLILMFILTMGGRLIPPATVGALRSNGKEVRIPFQPHYESGIIAAVALLIAAELLAAVPLLSALAALTASIAIIARMRSWRSLQILNHPQLWPLHLGYAWIGGGFLLFGLARLGVTDNLLGSIHLLTLGGIGTITLTMLCRVTQQRRKSWQISPNRLLLIQALLISAVITRFVSSWPNAPALLLHLSAASWSLAFLLFGLRALPLCLPVSRPADKPTK